MKNKEGYPDPTAGRAIRNADLQPEQVQWYFRTVRELANLVDLEVEKLPKIRDKKNREVVAVNVLKSVVIITWAITGTVNLIQGNIDRWDYLMVWGSLMAVLMIWR